MIGICGASGFIGWGLYNYFLSLGEEVLGTYCNHQKPGLVKFDLRTDHFSIFDNCYFVVITSAYAKIKFCEENPLEAYALNVFYTVELLEYLNDKHIRSLFISSDMAVNRVNNYGKYKAMVEQYIDQNKLRAKYIRPGRINKDNIRGLCSQILGYFIMEGL